MVGLNYHNTPTPHFYEGEDIVLAISNNGITYDVGSAHPGGGTAPKGLAVRQLKRHASWVQTVVRQVGPYLLQASNLEWSWS